MGELLSFFQEFNTVVGGAEWDNPESVAIALQDCIFDYSLRLYDQADDLCYKSAHVAPNLKGKFVNAPASLIHNIFDDDTPSVQNFVAYNVSERT
ncbi:hypothetical protein PCE1_001270 [Barthelona sp. PCE]